MGAARWCAAPGPPGVGFGMVGDAASGRGAEPAVRREFRNPIDPGVRTLEVDAMPCPGDHLEAPVG